ncbi:MAG: 3,4-dihydroxy-2-butanone-4-phosphate synthase, partial [Terriglobales bacterium]
NFGTAFCESVDARRGISTGISAADRALTIQALVDERSAAADFARPGHVFPLRARAGGVLARAGQTEAAVDLARLAGLRPAGIICEIMNEDGSMARVPELTDFIRQHGLKMITVADLIRHRLAHERHMERIGESPHASAYGPCRLVVYRNQLDGQPHSALIYGNITGVAPVLVRVQRHCLPGALGSTQCRCARNLDAALRKLQQADRGILVYLHHSGPGYALGADGRVEHGPAEPESEIRRQTGLGAQILQDLGARELLVLTDHPRPLAGLEAYGLRVAGCVPLQTE